MALCVVNVLALMLAANPGRARWAKAGRAWQRVTIIMAMALNTTKKMDMETQTKMETVAEIKAW
jgi:hypothetical protein